MPNHALLALAAVGGALITLLAGCTLVQINEAHRLASESAPFSISPPNTNARLLIAGDSTAVGTGASSPQTSLAGLVSTTMPRLAITNAGVNGARFADVVIQLKAHSERFDAVLIQAGGNDVIRLTAAAALRRDIQAALANATKIAPIVMLMPAGNVGNAPFFFAPWSWWMTARARTLHKIIREEAARTGAIYINLFKSRALDPFAQHPERFHAADGLHPSDAGYRLWLDELLAQSPALRNFE